MLERFCQLRGGFVALVCALATLGHDAGARPFRRWGGIPAQVIAADQIAYLPVTGQSNALGNDSASALSTTQPYGNQRWNNTDTIDLVETTLESLTSGIANQITFLDPTHTRISIMHNWAVGATAYSGLALGQAPYTNAVTEAGEAFADFPSEFPNNRLCVGPLIIDHGETDANNGRTAAQYQADLTTWGSDWRASMLAGGRTICPGAPLAVFSQKANWTIASGGQSGIATVAMGQFNAHRANPSQYVLTGPEYPYPASTSGTPGLHRTNAGHRLKAEYDGKAMYYGWITGRTWLPLEPATISCDANVITMTVQGGLGSTDLVVDTTSVALRPQRGFEYGETSDQTDLPVVVSTSVSGRTVTITLDRNCDSDARLRYAYSGIQLLPTALTANGGPGGNIRNQDNTGAQHVGTSLPDWLVGFDLAVDSCANCTPSATWTFANTDSLLIDNSPLTYASSMRHITDFDGAATVSVCQWVRGNGTTWNNGGTVVTVAQGSGTGNHRQFQCNGTGTNNEVCRIASSSSDTTTAWTGAALSHAGLAAAWGMICMVYDGTQADGGDAGSDANDERFNYYLCVAGACSEISTAGTFAGTMPATMTASTLADFAVGAASTGGAGGATMERTQSHVSMWTVALSAANVDSLYNAGTPVDPRTVGAGPCHYWPLQNNTADVGSCTARPLRIVGTGSPYSTLNP